jgi:RNA polymerase sigma factor (sigma-70 family)
LRATAATPQNIGCKMPENSPSTLGDVLYAKPSPALVLEKDWLGLVTSIAARDPIALHALYERTHRLVFTSIMRITSNRAIAEQLTLDIYDDVWKRAHRFNGENGTVLGWIMNQARFKAIDWLRAEQHKNRPQSERNAGLLPIDAPDYRDVLQIKEQAQALRAALAVLTADERKTIEAAYLSELTCVQIAARMEQPSGAIKARIRSALHKLRQALPNAGLPAHDNHCEQSELVCAHAVRALPREDVPALEAHLTSCLPCRREWEALSPVVGYFVVWPTDVLRPPASLHARLAQHIAAQLPGKSGLPSTAEWSWPEWEQVAPGISCKLLAADTQKHVISMLVCLEPGGEYPPHTHAGVEELHLLEGELWIDDLKLHPGDYNRAEPGTSDSRVWSQTGCTCVLVTSTQDVLR